MLKDTQMCQQKHLVTRNNQEEEYDDELWKAIFDYISQNVEYNNKIVNSQPKLSSSRHVRKLNVKCFN